MTTLLLLLIIALAVAVGCYVGQKHFLDNHKNTSNHAFFSRDYFAGLNYLLNEQPDKAVDIFTRLLQIDTETVETHLALGSLFRRRGEVDRAIKIHQNLVARPQLSKEQRVAALVALGKDYFHAGLVDRAERVFLEVTSLGEQPAISLHYLLEIYQQQKNWLSAVKVAQQLSTLTDEPLSLPIAHYHCEIAYEFLQKQDTDMAIKTLKQALKCDPQCVRASLLIADIEQRKSRFKAAIQQYEQILMQDPKYFSEALPGLISCYSALDEEKKLIDFLIAHLSTLTHIAFVLYITACFRKAHDDSKAIQFLTQYLKQHTSLKGLQYLIQLQLENATSEATQNDLLILQALVNKLLGKQPDYRCTQCGFKSNILLWLCPGCKTWSHIKPLSVD